MSTAPLTIRLAAPRGFCAGVERAVQIVIRCLEKYGAPVYVRHEIVHNRHVVDDLKSQGAIFVEELDEVPDDRPVIFSAHGVPKSVPAEAARRNMIYIDATCPLVSKVHMGAERHHKADRHILLIGHAGHPEVIGTIGQLPPGEITLIQSVEDARGLEIPEDRPLAYITQTTLSVDDTREIIDALKERYPDLNAPIKEDICYATTNRQQALKSMVKSCDGVLVIGAANSSNSRRLVEVAMSNGCTDSRLIAHAGELDMNWLKSKRTIGLTAGASAPETLVTEVINACRTERDVTVEEVEFTKEQVHFKLPLGLNA